MATTTSNPSRSKAVREAVWLTFVAIASQLSLAAVFAVIGLLVFLAVADGVASGQTRLIDDTIRSYFLSRQPDWFQEPLRVITALANGPTLLVVVAVGILLLALEKRFWPDAAIVLVTTMGGWALVELIKVIFERPRPPGAVAIGYSFPSGHAFLSLTVYGCMAFYASQDLAPTVRRSVWTFTLLVALLVGSSRVLLGVHYPSDVLAGFMGSAFWLWGCLSLRRLATRRDWRSWRESRLARLRAAKDILRKENAERERLEHWLSVARHSQRADLKNQLLFRFFSGAYALGNKVRAWRQSGLDLLLLARALEHANLEEIEDDTQAVRRRLHMAQRGVFGYAIED